MQEPQLAYLRQATSPQSTSVTSSVKWKMKIFHLLRGMKPLKSLRLNNTLEECICVALLLGEKLKWIKVMGGRHQLNIEKGFLLGWVVQQSTGHPMKKASHHWKDSNIIISIRNLVKRIFFYLFYPSHKAPLWWTYGAGQPAPLPLEKFLIPSLCGPWREPATDPASCPQ